MRPNQQSKRSRNRNGGRKSVNPLSRNFESNGPDVKIRGNAAHIAEKYVQLARDAQASGDSVMAENYFQHAEHYFRILSAAQAQNPGRPDQQVPAGFGAADRDTFGDDEGDDEGNEPRSERPVAAPPAEDGAPPAANGAEPAGEREEEVRADEPRRPRRPRRKPREGAEGQPAADPGAAPQPDLPAFITAGGQAAAE